MSSAGLSDEKKENTTKIWKACRHCRFQRLESRLVFFARVGLILILASLSWAQGGDARAARKAAQEAIPKLSGQELGRALEVVRDSSFSLGDYEAAGSAARRAVGLLDLEHDAENWGAV